MEIKTKNKVNVLNILWAFNTGGIGKLFLTYSNLGNHDQSIKITSVCIDLQNCNYDRRPLTESGVRIIAIKNRKDLSWVKSLGLIANEANPDVVFCHGFNGPIIVKLCSIFFKSMRVPMVCTYHGLYNPPVDNRKYIANIINKVQAWMYKKYAHTVVLVAKYSGIYLISQNVPKEKLVVVYNGISANVKSIGSAQLKSEGISIGVAGRLDSIKGLNFLLDAIPIVKQRVNQKFHLYIVGDGPEEDSLRKQAQKLCIDDIVSFEGYQSNVPSWLNSWDIFCLPSLQENHSIALLEAMRASKAIVCTSVGGNTETVTDGKEAIVIPPKDSTAIAEAFIKLIESESLRKIYGHNAYIRFISNFTEDIMKTKICNILLNAKEE